MGKSFVPMQFRGIDEGRLAEALDEELATLARDHLSHIKKYEDDLPAKTKSILTLKITIEHNAEASEDGMHSIKGAITRTLPARPSSATLAIEDHEQLTGEQMLFTRTAGSDKTNPRQGKLATLDGRAIDQETGRPETDKPHPPADRRSASTGK